MAVDPRDPVAVAGALAEWASERFAGDVRVAGAPTAIGGGFDSHIHLVQLTGDGLEPAWRAPLVVRLLPSADRVEQSQREADVQRWSAEQGYAAPAVLAVLPPDAPFGLPAQVMERAPGTTMLAALTAKPWRALRLVDQLAQLQIDLHALPTEGWPGPTDPRALVDQRLSLPRRAAPQLGDANLVRALDRAQGLAAIAASGPAVVCHGDFHPLNVVVDGRDASVIDWTDAGLGPREADVARTLVLFHIAAIAATGKVEQVALRLAGPRIAKRYRRAYVRASALDPQRMAVWEALHAIHGWAQVLTLHAGGFAGQSSADGQEDRVPLALAGYLEGRVERALAAAS